MPSTNVAVNKIVPSRAAWPQLLAQLRKVSPEVFDAEGHVLNLVGGKWAHPGHGKVFLSPVDGTPLGRYPMLDVETARRAVDLAQKQFESWRKVGLEERKKRVVAFLDELGLHRDLLALMLVWEIGKPYGQALVSVDRCLNGIRWYLENIDPMLEGRKPLGVISNIASWNYPMSVLVHAVIVQTLAGNATIAKTPTDGGLFAVTLAHAVAARHGLPVSLVSGSGGQLSEALVRNEAIAGLAFVGGKTNGRDIAAQLYDRSKRYMLEMEGVNAYGIWDFSDWSNLAKQMKKGFEFGKQRCTAYPRFVVQRELFPKFLETHMEVLRSIRCGNPVLVEKEEDPLPALDFGPLINSSKVEDLQLMVTEATANGGLVVYQGELDESLFLPDQDNSAYVAPITLINVPRSCRLYHSEPFGPITTIVAVDGVEELIAEMNVSNGSLVASVACDDEKTAKDITGQLRSFKAGVNRVRSRGDNEECFGGIGQSWKGCFVGGKYLVEAVTEGPPEAKLYGNFPDYILLPENR